MKSARIYALIAIILSAAGARLIPHPPNVTPIAAMALFAGTYASSFYPALLLPLGAMLLSDLVIGWHPIAPVVYLCFIFIVVIGRWLRRERTISRMVVAVGSSSVSFFLITNFAVWAFGAMYPKSVDGLVGAYVAGIPFLRNTVLGDAFYSVILFGGFALLERYVAALREPSPPLRSYS